MIANNQDGNKKEFKFDSETNEDDQNKMVVSQVDINQGVVNFFLYQEIVYYLLQDQCPSWMNSSQCRGLKMKCESYVLCETSYIKGTMKGFV